MPGVGEVNADSDTFLSSPYKSWLYSNNEMNDKIMKEFKMKYPKADITKFYVKDGSVYVNDPYIGRVEIDDPTFKKSRYYDMWLLGKKLEDPPLDRMFHLSEGVVNKDDVEKVDDVKKVIKESRFRDGWLKIWAPGGKVPKFEHLIHPSKARRKGWGHHEIIDTSFQKFVNLNEQLHNFMVYVNDKEYFMSKLPSITVRWSTGKERNQDLPDIRDVKFDYKKEPYFAMISGMYIASFLCGVSLLNLTDVNIPNIVRSIVKYHLYYQTRKFMVNPKLIDHYDISGVKKLIPVKYIEIESTSRDGDGHKYFIMTAIEYSDSDYRSFIAYSSDGLTVIGQELFQESIESFAYCILGAQARSHWSIVNKGAKSSQTQDVFRKIVEDTII